MSPTQRSLALLRKQGYHCAIVEKWNPYAKIRQDVFGFGDLLAFRSGQPGATLVQTTSGSNVSARRTKILANPIARDWVKAGNWIRLEGWAKRGARGQVKRWTANTEWIVLDQFPVVLEGDTQQTEEE